MTSFEGGFAVTANIRFGILGAGMIAPFHAKAIKAAGAGLVGFASRTEDKAAKLAADFGCKSWPSYEAMLADPEVNAVDITIPNHLHYQAAIAAAKAGKHVLVEKPPAMSLAHVDEMIATANHAGVKLGVVLNFRTKPAIQAIHAALEQGRFGRIFEVDATMKWWRDDAYFADAPWRTHKEWGGGATIQQGFHFIDLMQYFGGRVVSVNAQMGNLAHPNVPVDDNVRALVEFESGVVGSFLGSTALWPGHDIHIEIYGENGSAAMVGERMAQWKFRDERPEDAAIRELGKDAGPSGSTGAADMKFIGHQLIVEDFVRAIEQKSEPLGTGESARHTLEIAFAMYKSANSGKPVKLPLLDESGIS